MKRAKIGSIAIDAFFDNFTLGALFGKLHIPGSPRVDIDPRSLEDFSGDEVLKGIPEGWSKSLLKPLENLQQSR